jgi:hypothetical protein
MLSLTDPDESFVLAPDPPIVTTVSFSLMSCFEGWLECELIERTLKIVPRKLPKDVLANIGRSVGRQQPISPATISTKVHTTTLVFSP